MEMDANELGHARSLMKRVLVSNRLTPTTLSPTRSACKVGANLPGEISLLVGINWPSVRGRSDASTAIRRPALSHGRHPRSCARLVGRSPANRADDAKPAAVVAVRESRSRYVRRHGRILDPELLQIRVVLRRIVVELPHLLPILRHLLGVEPRRRLIGRRHQGT